MKRTLFVIAATVSVTVVYGVFAQCGLRAASATRGCSVGRTSAVQGGCRMAPAVKLSSCSQGMCELVVAEKESSSVETSAAQVKTSFCKAAACPKSAKAGSEARGKVCESACKVACERCPNQGDSTKETCKKECKVVACAKTKSSCSACPKRADCKKENSTEACRKSAAQAEGGRAAAKAAWGSIRGTCSKPAATKGACVEAVKASECGQQAVPQGGCLLR